MTWPSGKPVETIRLGFIPLLDAAVPIVAACRGFASNRGIAIELVRETSWANIRDRLTIGHFDAAHMLAPMPVAAALGLTPIDVPMIAPIALGSGGNAITVSSSLWAAMHSPASPGIAGNALTSGKALANVIHNRRGSSQPRLVFAVVHPYSMHNYALRNWLDASGIDPDHDVAMAIVPPPMMPDALAAGRIDGFCVGDPWNSLARARDGAHILLAVNDQRGFAEKVLGLRADWADADPDRLDRLLAALADAARWCAAPENRVELAQLLADPRHIGVEAGLIAASLGRQLTLADGQCHTIDGFLDFWSPQAIVPSPDQAAWCYQQIVRWNGVPASEAGRQRAIASFRPDLTARALTRFGLVPGQ